MPKNLDSFKQGITFLLTIPGIPQIYYGTELLMNGNKSKSDGDIRKDVPGGWPDDSVNQFTAEGRSELQNEAFDFMQKLLKWRQGNEILAKGKMKHYVPQNGVYVYERYLNDKSIVVFMNGTSKEASIDLGRYTESIKNRKTANDIISGQQIQFADKLVMSPRQIMIFEI
jgi:glycosidase